MKRQANKSQFSHLYGAHHHGILRCSNQIHAIDRSSSTMSPKALGVGEGLPKPSKAWVAGPIL